jgi:hypothetical protein
VQHVGTGRTGNHENGQGIEPPCTDLHLPIPPVARVA